MVSASKMKRLEEQANNGKISDEDMDLMTNHKVKFTKTHSELKHYLTNFYSLTSILFCPQALLSMEIGKVKQQVSKCRSIFHAQDTRRGTEVLTLMHRQEQTRHKYKSN